MRVSTVLPCSAAPRPGGCSPLIIHGHHPLGMPVSVPPPHELGCLWWPAVHSPSAHPSCRRYGQLPWHRSDEFSEGISILFTPSSATVAAVPTAGPGTEKPCTVLTLLAWWHARHSLGMPWATCSLTWPAWCQVCLGNLISPCPSWANSGRGAARLAAQQGRLPSLHSRRSAGLRGGPSHAVRSPWELVSPALPSVGV